MSYASFIQLLEDFSTLTAIGEPEVFLRERVVTVDGVAFSLVHDETADEDLFVYADFGALPSHEELAVCKALMEANLLLFASRKPIGFAISPNTDHVTLACRVTLERISAEALRRLLIELAGKALAWRQHRFLDLKPATPAPGGPQRRDLAGRRQTRAASHRP